METFVLCLFFLLVAGAAIYAALVPHTLYCIVGLGVTLFGIAGLFLYLGSPFIAAMQVLIYIGGISVAMIFALMLSASLSRPVHHPPRKVAFGAVIAFAFFAVMAMLTTRAEFPLRAAAPPEEAWALGRVGEEFLTTYNLVFEGLSLVLLLAIMAAVLIAKKQEPAP